MDNLNEVRIRLVKGSPLWSTTPMQTPRAAVSVLGDYIRELDREALCVVNLDSKLRPINFSIVSVGTVNQSIANPGDIMKSAILSNASFITMLHNHPSSDLSPSKQDIEITERMIEVGNLLSINLIDHIIVGPEKDEFYSLREKNEVNFHAYTRFDGNIENLNFKTEQGLLVAEEEVGRSR
ncbi:MAG: JAB domain-containing protein [Lachnospiraceae bacterium]|nr:JAB domain-containing protein [Lachnospiraceae bacterium]